MPNMAAKNCLNHAKVPAVSTCETCSRPLCENCILEVAGSHYCSENCATINLDKLERIALLNSRNIQSEGTAFRMNLIILLVLAGLAYAGFVHWHNLHKTPMDKSTKEAVKSFVTK